MAPDTNSLLKDLLKAVSRSFYLTLRMLPASVRPQIGLAYLLARATDTIADTDAVPVSSRLEHLARLRKRIMGEGGGLDLSAIITNEGSLATTAAERTLLCRIEEAIQLLCSFSTDDQRSIRKVITTITGGQALDLERFAGATTTAVRALDTDTALDDYTYRVAGCVGEFWTEICLRHAFPLSAGNLEYLLRNGIRFGKGLQLVNILRDLPRDLQQGRCYIPNDRLAGIGLAPQDLLSPQVEPIFRPVYDELLDLARSHLSAGWDYTNALPHSAIRVRLACAVPVLIGIETICRLRRGRVLDPAHRIKIPRADVRRIVRDSILRYPLPSWWQRLFADCEARSH